MIKEHVLSVGYITDILTTNILYLKNKTASQMFIHVFPNVCVHYYMQSQ